MLLHIILRYSFWVAATSGHVAVSELPSVVLGRRGQLYCVSLTSLPRNQHDGILQHKALSYAQLRYDQIKYDGQMKSVRYDTSAPLRPDEFKSTQVQSINSSGQINWWLCLFFRGYRRSATVFKQVLPLVDAARSRIPFGNCILICRLSDLSRIFKLIILKRKLFFFALYVTLFTCSHLYSLINIEVLLPAYPSAVDRV